MEPQPQEGIKHVPVLYGYSVTELEIIAQRAARSALSVRISTTYHHLFIDRYEAAWMAIVEHLLVTGRHQPAEDLLTVGQKAVNHEVTRTRKMLGLNGHGPIRGFKGYWTPVPTPTPPDIVDEVLAVQRIWPLLKPWEREVLLSLADNGHPTDAARAIGWKLSSFKVTLSNARKRIYSLLLLPDETARRKWGNDRQTRRHPIHHMLRYRKTGRWRRSNGETE